MHCRYLLAFLCFAFALTLEAQRTPLDSVRLADTTIIHVVKLRDGSTTTFAERGIGDVFISWENEAFLAQKELGKDKIEIVVPSLSILAEPPVTVVDQVVDKRGTRALATEYLKFWNTREAQEIAGRNFYRPRDPQILAKYAEQFVNVKLITIDEVFGGWKKAQNIHFADGGVFDQIYSKK